MGVYDTIKGAPKECDDQVKCWADACLRTFKVGDLVDRIDGHNTYSVKYNLSDLFWHVKNGFLVSVNASGPQDGYPVFDKWGEDIEAQGSEPT